MVNKKAYYLGGGGVNEPTPGKKKYPSDKAIVVQPRFVEPFYRNYDLYDVEGVDGPAKHGPGSGWNHMNEFKSIKDFLEYRRQRLQGKYVATDDWIEDTKANRKERVEKMKLRATFFSQIVKTAADENDGPNFDYGHGAYDAMNEGKKMKSITDFKRTSPGAFFADDNADHMLPPKEHGTKIYDWKNSPYQGKPKAPKRHDSNKVKDDGKPNYDLGSGLYENLDKYDSVEDFKEHTPLGYKYPAKIKTEKARAKDVNHIDFPVDDDVNHDTPIRPEEGQYHVPKLVGPEGPPGDMASQPGFQGSTETQIEFTSPQIAGEHSYVPEHDFDGRSDDALNFGRDYDDESAPIGRSWDENSDDDKELDLDMLEAKYLPLLQPHETEIYGLPDGVGPEGKDADQTIETENPEFGIPDSGEQMYQDKWNI